MTTPPGFKRRTLVKALAAAPAAWRYRTLVREMAEAI